MPSTIEDPGGSSWNAAADPAAGIGQAADIGRISGPHDQDGPLAQLNDPLCGRSEKSEIEGVPPANSHHDEVGLRLCRVLQNLLVCFSDADRRFHCKVLSVLWNHCLKL